MVMKDGPEQQEEVTDIIPGTLREIAPVEVSKLAIPQGISSEDVLELEKRAEDLVSELELIDSVTGVGIQAQRRAKSELDLLRGRVSDMITQEGTGAEVSKDLINLRMALNEINPHQFSQPGLAMRLYS